MNQKLLISLYFACWLLAGMLLHIAAEWLRRTL